MVRAHVIVLPGGGYATHVPHEAEPVVDRLAGVDTLALAALLVPSAWGKFTRDDRQVGEMRAIGFPPAKLWLVACAESGHPRRARGARPRRLLRRRGGLLARARITKATVLASAGGFVALSAAVLGLHLSQL
ncbi:hypothetical protein [Kutzneria buriramensis]|uniref:Uncharacterized protein n=1 Tax=Kutzneria buriramensis TaxID=1045776 RepID=A0A3E0G7Z9_9PSEU|nr:hypothetical protein [Kutzneria buriramensis]REH17947.1 hypothetical protein BCF44_14027 [Kutzneria buriramensis]